MMADIDEIVKLLQRFQIADEKYHQAARYYESYELDEARSERVETLLALERKLNSYIDSRIKKQCRK